MEKATLTFITDIATLIGVVVAAFTLYKGVLEYRLQNRQKRFEHIKAIRDAAAKNESFQNILAALELEDGTLADLPLKEKADFLSFYEEIALSVNSGLISEDLAHHWYSEHLLLCWKSKNFWKSVEIGGEERGMDLASPEWSVLKTFVEDMKRREKGKKRWLGLGTRKLRF